MVGGVTLADPEPPPSQPTWTRRRLLAAGAGGVVGIVGVAVAGFELVEHGVLPGKHQLDELDGACSVSSPKLTFATPGPSRSGTFFSAARNRTVGYTIAYPPNRGPGDRLPLVISLHGDGGNHRSRLGDLGLATALAARSDGRALPPFALVAVDGGNLYWNPHPGDDPLAMLVDELIPFCRQRGLGVRPQTIGTIGISMGGYGSLLLTERHPRLISVVSAISPAVWASYSHARSASADGFASASDWAADDVITHASALAGTPVRIASGTDDPLHPGVVALAHALPHSAVVVFTAGCHDDAFFGSQQHASLAFLGEHLSAT
jgi:enterochelin esterase-like enzyme